MVELIRKNKHLLVSVIVLIGIASISFVAYDSIFKDVAILVDGDEIMLRTSKATVSELLAENEINLDKEDYINVSLDENLRDGLEINITRIDEKVEVQNEEISYQTIIRDNKALEIGKTLKVQNGEKGVIETTVKEIYENGVFKSSEIVEQRISKEPVTEIIEKGTKDVKIASRGSFSGNRSIVMTATAYDLSYESTGKNPGDKHYGITASGTKAKPGTVAVDPKVIPLGTKLYIESMDGSKDYGYAVAEDTGGAIKGNKIDLFIESSKEVEAFGRRKVRVYIISGK